MKFTVPQINISKSISTIKTKAASLGNAARTVGTSAQNAVDTMVGPATFNNSTRRSSLTSGFTATVKSFTRGGIQLAGHLDGAIAPIRAKSVNPENLSTFTKATNLVRNAVFQGASLGAAGIKLATAGFSALLGAAVGLGVGILSAASFSFKKTKATTSSDVIAQPESPKTQTAEVETPLVEIPTGETAEVEAPKSEVGEAPKLAA